MDDFILFLKDYSSLILFILGLCSLIITAIFDYSFYKKSNISIIGLISNLLLKNIPDFINDAEKSGLSGQAKFSQVFKNCVYLVNAVTNENNDKIALQYGNLISSAIESILSTPQKKGDNYER